MVMWLIGKVWSLWGALLAWVPGSSVFASWWGKLGAWLRKHKKSLPALLLGLLIFGCAARVSNSDPTPGLAKSIEAAKGHVDAAQAELEKTPPAVPAAKRELTGADKELDRATTQTKEVSAEFNRVEAERQKLAAEVAKLKSQFWSPRQVSYFRWAIFLTVVLGVLAAVGNHYPGWWSLPALFAIKAARFVLFAGIPHAVNAVQWLITRVIGWFRKQPQST